LEQYIGGITHAILHLLYSAFLVQSDARLASSRMTSQSAASSTQACTQGRHGHVQVKGNVSAV